MKLAKVEMLDSTIQGNIQVVLFWRMIKTLQTELFCSEGWLKHYTWQTVGQCQSNTFLIPWMRRMEQKKVASPPISTASQSGKNGSRFECFFINMFNVCGVTHFQWHFAQLVRSDGGGPSPVHLWPSPDPLLCWWWWHCWCCCCWRGWRWCRGAPLL